MMLSQMLLPRMINFLNSHSAEATIIEVMHQLPFPNVIVILFLIAAFLFLVTTFDSASYILLHLGMVIDALLQ